MTENINLKCQCGFIEYELIKEPFFRFYCHCTICQSSHKADYSDINLSLARDIRFLNENSINYNILMDRGIPRGSCPKCHQSVLSRMKFPFMPELVFVPSKMYSSKNFLLPSKFHIYYATKVCDVDDNLPKARGHFLSQFLFAWKFLVSLFSKLF